MKVPPGAFRLVLASIVVLSHFSKFEIGRSAVSLFFVLSGFWIYRMYAAKYSRADSPALLFIASRLMRLLPVFLLFNLLALGLHGMLHDKVAAGQTPIDVIPNLLIVGYASLPERALVPAWSLDVELQFYIIFPLLFVLTQATASLARAVLGIALLAGCVYLAFILPADHAATVIPYIGFFLLGVISARDGWKIPNAMVLGSTLLWLGILVCATLVPALRGVVLHTNSTVFAWNAALNVLLALVAAPVALASVHVKSNRNDRILGDLSYVLYCSHWLAVVVAAAFLAHVSHGAKAPALIGIVVATYAVSFGVLMYIDRPISRWRERWVDGHLLRPARLREAAESS